MDGFADSVEPEPAAGRRRLKVTGRAERRVVPDEARWTVVLRREDAASGPAFEHLREERSRLISAFEGLSAEAEISAEAIAVNSIGVHEPVLPSDEKQLELVELLRRFDDDPHLEGRVKVVLDKLIDRRWVPRGFRAEAGLAIKLPLDAAEHVPAMLVEAGAVHVSGPRFEISDRREIEAELLNEAIAEARRRAGAMAEAAAATLGPPVLISDERESFHESAVAAGALRRRSGALRTQGADDGEASEAPAIVELRPGPVTLSYEASVLFELGQ